METALQRTPLPTTLEEGYKYAQINSRIVPWAPYGQHIGLTCKNHPELSWSTKNISYIGARSIFYDYRGQSECGCSGHVLIVKVPEQWLEHIIPLQIIKCHCCLEELHEERDHNSTHCHECFEGHCGYPTSMGSKEIKPCKVGKRK